MRCEAQRVGLKHAEKCSKAPLDFSTSLKDIDMNKDQVKGSVKDAAGKVQQKTGEVIGSTEQQAKGVAKQVEGKIQKGFGDAKEAAKDANRKP